MSNKITFYFKKLRPMKTFGIRLREKRNEKGLNQTQLANLLGIEKHNTVSNWEKDLAKPSADDLVILSEVLETTPNYLLLGKEEKNYDALEKENSLLNEMLSVYRKVEKIEKELEQTKNIENVSNFTDLDTLIPS